ncbi:MAG: peptidase MA family metallohydrolase [Chloroflexia bacterium]
MCRWWKAGLLLLILALWPWPAWAQGGLRFEGMAAQGNFPNEILFTVVVESDAEITHLELAYRVSGDPFTRSRYPNVTPSRRQEVTYRLDTQVEFYPPGSEFHYYWIATDASGRTSESPEQVFTYEDNRFTWQQVATDRVTVYWYRGDEAFGRAVLHTAVQALERLEQDAGVRAERPIRIYLYANEEDFRGALGPNSPEWIGGQAMPHLGLIVAYISPEDTHEIGRMIPHELSHVVLYQATHNPYGDNPTWFEEGLAVHNQEVPDYDYPLLVREAARRGRLIPLRALSASFPSDPDLAVLSYAESASMIEFILQAYGSAGLSALVQVFAEGETAEAAVQRALGLSLEELEARWRATLPAAEQTPVPGETPMPFPFPKPPAGPDLALLLPIALTTAMALGVIVAAVVLLMRRHRRTEMEEDEVPGP